MISGQRHCYSDMNLLNLKLCKVCGVNSLLVISKRLSSIDLQQTGNAALIIDRWRYLHFVAIPQITFHVQIHKFQNIKLILMLEFRPFCFVNVRVAILTRFLCILLYLCNKIRCGDETKWRKTSKLTKLNRGNKTFVCFLTVTGVVSIYFCVNRL